MAWLSGGAQRHPLSQLSLGGGGGDGADYRIVDRPALHPDAAHAAGKGTADPRRRTAEPSREKGHADDGRADDPDRADDLGAALDGQQAGLGRWYFGGLGVAVLLVVYEFVIARHRDPADRQRTKSNTRQ